MGKIILADNMDVLPEMPEGCVDLIYIDPPFNTGRVQERTRLRTVRDESGDRVGFQGRRYRTIRIGSAAFDDRFDDLTLETALVQHRGVTDVAFEFPIGADAGFVGESIAPVTNAEFIGGRFSR